LYIGWSIDAMNVHYTLLKGCVSYFEVIPLTKATYGITTFP